MESQQFLIYRDWHCTRPSCWGYSNCWASWDWVPDCEAIIICSISFSPFFVTLINGDAWFVRTIFQSYWFSRYRLMLNFSADWFSTVSSFCLWMRRSLYSFFPLWAAAWLPSLPCPLSSVLYRLFKKNETLKILKKI